MDEKYNFCHDIQKDRDRYLEDHCFSENIRRVDQYLDRSRSDRASIFPNNWLTSNVDPPSPLFRSKMFVPDEEEGENPFGDRQSAPSGLPRVSPCLTKCH